MRWSESTARQWLDGASPSSNGAKWILRSLAREGRDAQWLPSAQLPSRFAAVDTTLGTLASALACAKIDGRLRLFVALAFYDGIGEGSPLVLGVFDDGAVIDPNVTRFGLPTGYLAAKAPPAVIATLGFFAGLEESGQPMEHQSSPAMRMRAGTRKRAA